MVKTKFLPCPYIQKVHWWWQYDVELLWKRITRHKESLCNGSTNCRKIMVRHCNTISLSARWITRADQSVRRELIMSIFSRNTVLPPNIWGLNSLNYLVKSLIVRQSNKSRYFKPRYKIRRAERRLLRTSIVGFFKVKCWIELFFWNALIKI